MNHKEVTEILRGVWIYKAHQADAALNINSINVRGNIFGSYGYGDHHYELTPSSPAKAKINLDTLEMVIKLPLGSQYKLFLKNSGSLQGTFFYYPEQKSYPAHFAKENLV